MPSYLALLHTNRGYQRFKMIELALTTYSVLFVDNQSLLCKWRFHNCTAYAIFILMIQSVYWIIDQYLSVMQSYFLKNAFPCSLTAFFFWNIFLNPIYVDRLYIYEMGCVLGWFLLACLYPAFNIWWLPIFGQGPCPPLEMCQHWVCLLSTWTWLVLTKGCLFKWFRMWGTLPAPTQVQNPNLIDYSLMILVHLNIWCRPLC